MFVVIIISVFHFTSNGNIFCENSWDMLATVYSGACLYDSEMSVILCVVISHTRCRPVLLLCGIVTKPFEIQRALPLV
jgi:hypothetical protein